jgi:YecR-like lipoprotein
MKSIIRQFALFAALTGAALLTGCAVEKQLIPTGGSRSDGTVKLSFEYGAFEVPKLDTTQALKLAQQRCAAWGYTGADPFGGGTKRCTFGNVYGCNRWVVTFEYQCTGTPTASK